MAHSRCLQNIQSYRTDVDRSSLLCRSGTFLGIWSVEETAELPQLQLVETLDRNSCMPVVVQRQMSVGVTSLGAASLRKSWYFTCSHRRCSELLCARRCLHDLPDRNAGKRNTPVHIATRQGCCQRDHEGVVLETKSCRGLLFDDGRQQESNSKHGGTRDIDRTSDHPGRCSSSTRSRRAASLGPGQRRGARNSQNYGVSVARGTWPF